MTSAVGSLRSRPRVGGRALLTAPTFVLLAVALGGPLVYLLLYSFGFFSVTGAPPSAIAWTQFFGSAYYTGSLLQSLEVAGITTGICLVVGVPIALAVATLRSSWARTAVLIALFVPLFTSVVARAYGWELLLGADGPLSSLLRPFGVRDPNLLFRLPGVIIALVHVELPFMVFPLLTAVRQIDPSLVQAARDLGASPLRRFRTVTLPLALPGAVSGMQLVFALTTGAFATVNLLGGGRVRILATVIYDDVTNVRWSSAAVGCFVLIAVTLIVLAVFSALGRLVRYHPIEGAIAAPDAVGPGRWTAAKVLSAVWLAIVVAFMVAPLLLTMINSFSTVAYGAWPPPGFSLRWYGNLLNQGALLPALGVSLGLAILAAVVALAIGTAGAVGSSGRRGPVARALELGSATPNVVPKVALGFAAYIFFNTTRLLPGLSGVLVAHVLITLPFVFIVMRGVVDRVDRSLELAARDLGKGRVRAFFSATVPQLAPGLASSLLFAFIISFDEVDMTIFMVPQGVQTVPVWMYFYLQRYQDPTLSALSTVLIVFTLVLLGIVGLVTRAAARRTQTSGVPSV